MFHYNLNIFRAIFNGTENTQQTRIIKDIRVEMNTHTFVERKKNEIFICTIDGQKEQRFTRRMNNPLLQTK